MKLKAHWLLPLLLLSSSGAILTRTTTLALTSANTQRVIAKTVYEPIPQTYCQTLRDDAGKALGVKFSLKKGPFVNPLTGEKGSGCMMEAKGTGAEFRSPATVISKLRTAFVGWTEDTRYAADGPTGKATAFTRDQAVLLVNAEWNPASSAKCPKNQPISACPLKPAQQLYSIKLQVAMK